MKTLIILLLISTTNTAHAFRERCLEKLPQSETAQCFGACEARKETARLTEYFDDYAWDDNRECFLFCMDLSERDENLTQCVNHEIKKMEALGDKIRKAKIKHRILRAKIKADRLTKTPL